MSSIFLKEKFECPFVEVSSNFSIRSEQLELGRRDYWGDDVWSTVSWYKLGGNSL
jgi:hypothetical protein